MIFERWGVITKTSMYTAERIKSNTFWMIVNMIYISIKGTYVPSKYTLNPTIQIIYYINVVVNTAHYN